MAAAGLAATGVVGLMPIPRRPAAVGLAFAVLIGACTTGDPTGTPPLDTLAPPETSPTTTTTAPAPSVDLDRGVVVVATGGADLLSSPGGEITVRAHEGLIMGVTGREGDYLRVMDNCNDEQWVHAGSVEFTPQLESPSPGPAFDFSRAVIVLDPGHGGRFWGAVGPTGLAEKDVNLQIAQEARELLSRPHAIDWVSGDILAGDEIPAVAQVVLTRSETGPDEGDHELGLAHRAAVANGAGAHAFVSVHNNSAPRLTRELPGSQVYYRSYDPESRRLAGLIFEELLRSFEPFDADWAGIDLWGAVARIDPDGTEYFGILRRAEVPAAIVEGAYISNPDEEALLRTTEFRRAYAEALYRALVRFLTTDDPGSQQSDPRVIPGESGSPSASECRVPAQD